MKKITNLAILSSILLAGALFGFFFTLSFSVMPGLDLVEPYSAITANQEIGRATQNMFFSVVLLGTPLLLIVSFVLSSIGNKKKGIFLLVAALASFIMMMLVTAFLNVPLNQALDAIVVTPQQDNLQQIWDDYSIDWQRWNLFRLFFSGLTLLFASLALQKNATS